MNEGRSESTLKKSLKSRHMIMITIGGMIGTALFVATGAAVHDAGPGGSVVAYSVMAIMVYCLMTGLGEISTQMPHSGSLAIYTARFYDKATGFAMGWTYWYSWAITFAFELSAAAIVMKFWLPDIPGFLVSFVGLVLLVGINLTSVKLYGETEYWFSIIKVIAVVVFLIVGTLTILGFIGGESPGFKNWTIGEAPFVGGFSAILAVFLVAGFCFQGTEIVGVTAGESESPQKDVPRAIKTVLWRISIFFIGTLIIISFLIPYNDPKLLGAAVDNIALSPYVIVFENMGVVAAASIMNAVILTAVLSNGNGCLYLTTRTLYGLASEGLAPAIFAKVNKRGVPVAATLFTGAVGGVALLSSFFGENTVYLWLLNSSAITGFIVWLVMAACHFKFRKAYIAQGYDLNDLKYKSWVYPVGPIFAAGLSVVIIIGQAFFCFTPEGVDWMTLITTYAGVAIFGGCYLYYKRKYKTKLIKAEDIDLMPSPIMEEHRLAKLAMKK